jgi:hypothetical protein
VAIAVFTLGSCKIVTGILSWSLFPSFLSGVEATRNLRQELEDLIQGYETQFGCRIEVLRSPTYGDVDYVFLLVGTPRGNRLIVLNRNLDIVNTVENRDFGDRMMVDAEGNFIVGRERFYGADDPAPDEPVSDGDTYKPGLAAGGLNYLLYSGGDTLYIESYSPAWAWAATNSFSISSAGGNWNVAGVGYDASRAAQQVMLVLFAWDTNTLTVLFVDDTAVSAMTQPLQDNYVPGQGFSRALQAARRAHYTRKGVVVRTEGDNDPCYLLDYDGQELNRFTLNVRGGVEEAYDVEGEHFYYFGRDELILFKGRTGW